MPRVDILVDGLPGPVENLDDLQRYVATVVPELCAEQSMSPDHWLFTIQTTARPMMFFMNNPGDRIISRDGGMVSHHCAITVSGLRFSFPLSPPVDTSVVRGNLAEAIRSKVKTWIVARGIRCAVRVDVPAAERSGTAGD